MTNVQKFWTAEEQYKEHPEISKTDIKTLDDWCKKNSNTIPRGVTEAQLILFLHSCYGNLEETKKCISQYYSLRRKFKASFETRDIHKPEVQKALKVLHYGIFKARNPNGYKIVYHKLNDTDPSNYSYNDGFKLLIMACDSVYMREGPHDGVILLFDMAGVKLGHVARLPLSSIKKSLDYIQDANPIRLKGIHVLNVHPVIDKIMLLIRPFLKKQFLSLLHFHKEGDESVYDVVPKNCLPAEYGGVLENIETIHEQFIAEMEELRPIFLEEDEFLAKAFKALKGDKNAEKEIDISKLDID